MNCLHFSLPLCLRRARAGMTLCALGFSLGTGLAACGSKGPLYLPTEPEAADRTPLHRLPANVLPDMPSAAPSKPASPKTSTPTPTPPPAQ